MPDQHDFANMTAEEFEAWKAANAPSFAGEVVPASPPPSPQAPTDYESTAKSWSSRGLYDFVTPFGHSCQMRDPLPQDLLAAGLLGKVNVLKGAAEKLVKMGEGLPPEKMAEVVTPEEMKNLEEFLDALMPIVVVQPKVYPMPGPDEERVKGRVYPEDIDLTEKVAIMERSLRGVSKYANFRG